MGLGRSVRPVVLALGVACVPGWGVLAPGVAVASLPSTRTVAEVTSVSRLLGVDSVSPTDSWAVGEVRTDDSTRTLVEHWDGSAWHRVPSPSPGGTDGASLGAVTAISADDVWAVGTYHVSERDTRTLVLHWNGTRWSRVRSPSPAGRGDNVLSGVSAVSADDIWAVGYHSSPFVESATLTVHWDGRQWSTVPSPNPSHRFDNVLAGVSARTATDVWAVGSFSSSATTSSTLVVRWNGKRWSRPTSPSPGRLDNRLLGVSISSARDVWAVGSSSSLPTQSENLIVHWNGNRWSAVAGPDLGGADSSLFSISADSRTDAWAVGSIDSGPTQATLTLHWDGRGWEHVPSPSPGPFGSSFHGVRSTSPDDAVAVGTAYSGPMYADVLIASWDGATWESR